MKEFLVISINCPVCGDKTFVEQIGVGNGYLSRQTGKTVTRCDFKDRHSDGFCGGAIMHRRAPLPSIAFESTSVVMTFG